MGGEEFALFLADTTIDQGKIIALRIRKEIELMKIISGEPQQELTVTASLGVTCHKKDESLETMLERCDKALYLSKNNGRNRVTVL